MKIVGIEANCYDGKNGNGIEVLTRMYGDDGCELTACLSDYENSWMACVCVGFMTADEEPCEETVCEFHDRGEAFASEYGKVFSMMAGLADGVKAC